MSRKKIFKYKNIVIAVLVLAGAIVWFSNSGIPVGGLSTDNSGSRSEALSGRQVYYGPRHSIAVLPFTDLSSPPDRPWRADGFSHEIIERLVQVPELQVTARTSSFFFRGELPDAEVMGERLQAAYLLTGSFSQQDGRVTVEAHLLGARENRLLWSEAYEFDLDTLAGVQEKILTAVLDEINVGLELPVPGVGSVPAQARDRYLEGLYELEQRSMASVLLAEQAFASALELEPAYLDALIGLTRARLASGQEARNLLERALELAPESPQALGILSYVQRDLDWDWHGAARSGRRAVALRPGDADLLSRASLALFSLGEFEEGTRLLRESINRDPLNLHSRLRLGLVQEFSGKWEDALATYRVIVGLNAEYPGVYAYRTRIKVLQEKPALALDESEKETDPFWRRYARILALIAAEREDEALPLLAEMASEDGQRAAFQLAELHAFRAAVEPAFNWLAEARKQRDGGMAELIGNALLVNLHEDPRWKQILESLGHVLDAPE